MLIEIDLLNAHRDRFLIEIDFSLRLICSMLIEIDLFNAHRDRFLPDN